MNVLGHNYQDVQHRTTENLEDHRHQPPNGALNAHLQELWKYLHEPYTVIKNYTVSQKNRPTNFCLYLHQISTDFKNSFTDILCGKFAVTQLLDIPPHLNCVTTLPCEI